MPLFAYFAVVAPALLALLFVAEAQLGQPRAKALAYSTEFHGLPKPFKAPKGVAVLTVREAPAPDPAALGGAVAAAAEQPIMAQATGPEAKPQPERTAKRRTASKKTRQQQQQAQQQAWQNPPRNMFARAPQRQHGVVW